MTDKIYIDLRIIDGDFLLNTGREPTLCDNRVSIGQDIKHAIIESNYATQLIGQRSAVLRNDVYLKIILMIETDIRLIPGTVRVYEEGAGRFIVTAETYEFGLIDPIEVVYE
ncbi:DUF2590 family protein [Escherichia coli]|uniref:DUF2590 family protein n=1 Tax=Escherichia coli TaxID=562 RepID=UPI000BE4BD21|nr:DUF2590 family protein [Escherichia coli]MCX0808194.1 DUF2590 family protein [Escherichia coli]